jgi:hypothetical protein
LLAVSVFRRVSEAAAVPLALTDVFRYPTVRSFAAHLDSLSAGDGDATTNESAALDRGALRRRALMRRGGDPT